MPENATGSSYVFSSLEPSCSLGSPDYSHWRMVFRNQVSGLSVLTAAVGWRHLVLLSGWGWGIQVCADSCVGSALSLSSLCLSVSVLGSRKSVLIPLILTNTTGIIPVSLFLCLKLLPTGTNLALITYNMFTYSFNPIMQIKFFQNWNNPFPYEEKQVPTRL